MPEQLWFTEILNHLFASPVTEMLHKLGIFPKYPQAPISNSFAMELLVFLFLLLLFVLVRSGLSVDRPGGLQHMFEGVEGFIQGQSNEIIGHHSEGYTPFLTALFFFILVCNLIGVIPGFESPTAVPIVPLGCAIVAFVYYQYQGFKHAGIGYLKHFAGPHRARALADHPSFRQHVRGRYGHTGVLFAGSNRCAHRISRIAHRRLAFADVYFRFADDRLFAGRGFRRTLESRVRGQLSVLN
jgi:ATP synthase A chain